MPLDLANTRLNGKPYFDDFNENKNFHRILFRPAVAVQARELNQIQSIFQNQIERFASHQFKEGSVVNGCAFQHHANWNFMAVAPINDSARTTVVNEQGSPSIDSYLVGKTFVQRYPVGADTVESRGTIVQVRRGIADEGDPTKIFFVYDNENKVTTAPDPVANDGFGYELTIYDSVERYVDQVKLTLNAANLVTTGSDVSKIQRGDIIEGQTSKARGLVVEVGDSLSGTVPATRSYVLIERSYNTFIADETISVVSRTNTISGVKTSQNVAGVVPVDRQYGNVVGKIAPYTATSEQIVAGTALTGTAYGVTVAGGVIYQKGHFVRVERQSAVVNQFGTNPANKMVGFETQEEIITEYVDDSLYDNALGTPNYRAPGAHRLRLTPTLLVINRDDAGKYPGFLPIVEYGPDGAAFERTDAQYAAIGDEIARRTYEESGNYSVKPFTITTSRNQANSQLIDYRIGAGLAYVNGKRVESKKTFLLTNEKGIDVLSYNSLGITTSYGNYVIVNSLIGDFNPELGQSISLYDTVNGSTWLTSNLGNTSATVSGSAIGTANIRHIEPISVGGTPATNTYRVYLFNIQMTGNNAFDAVRSLVLTTNPKAIADIVLEGGKAVLQETQQGPLVWPIGLESVKNQRDANGTFASSYYYTHTGVATMTSGALSFPRSDTYYNFDFDSNEQSALIAIPAANVATNNLTGTITISGSTVTGASTQFQVDYAPGDIIRANSNNYVVNTVTSNTVMTIVGTATVNAGNNHQRWLYAGVPINLRALNAAGTAPLRPITVAGDDSQFSLTIPSSNGYSTSASVNLLFRAIKGTSATSALPLKKQVNRNVLIKLATGIGIGYDGWIAKNWNLGIPDCFRLNAVYLGSGDGSEYDTSKNYAADFRLITGQNGREYGHSRLELNAGANASIYDARYLIVSVDCFTIETPAANDRGGYFSIESYPIDDTKLVGSRDALTIRTEEIPFVNTGSSTLDLRNCIDFRPYATRTANLAFTVATASANPVTTTTFDSISTTFDPHPSYGRFTTNATQYVGRRDIIAIDDSGKFTVIEGAPSKKPKLPQVPDNFLQLGIVNIPPYPSYAFDEQTSETNALYNGAYNVTTKRLDSRRWTMRDITAIEQRVSRLEYYASLSALEIKARDMLIVDSSGDNRFKNGFLVDSFNSLNTGRVDNPEYRITIDLEKGMAVPFLVPEVHKMELDATNSSGYRITGGMLTYDFIDEPFVVQPYATRYVEPEPRVPDPPDPPRAITCTDPKAVNFGAVGACYYAPPEIRCMDPRATNYQEVIYPPTSGCVYDVTPSICMDPSANNYLAAGECTYYTIPLPTCNDPNATNFGQTGECVYLPDPEKPPRTYIGNLFATPNEWAIESFVAPSTTPDTSTPIQKQPILPPTTIIYDPISVGVIDTSGGGFVREDYYWARMEEK